MVEKIMKSAHGGGNHDLYDTSGGSASVSGGGHHPGDHRGNSSNNGVSHPLSSANPPGLPRPPLHPALSHSHGHSHNSHLMGGPGGSSHQHNGSPMQRLSHSALPHHGNHGPAPPPPTTHISNPPPSSQHHPMSNLSSGTSTTITAGGDRGSGSQSNSMPPQQQQPSQSLVSNGGLNGHTNMAHGTQLFGDTEPENEKWWWVCCLEFCFCFN